VSIAEGKISRCPSADAAFRRFIEDPSKGRRGTALLPDVRCRARSKISVAKRSPARVNEFDSLEMTFDPRVETMLRGLSRERILAIRVTSLPNLPSRYAITGMIDKIPVRLGGVSSSSRYISV